MYLEHHVAHVARVSIYGLEEPQSLAVQPEELPVLREHGIQLDLRVRIADYWQFGRRCTLVNFCHNTK